MPTESATDEILWDAVKDAAKMLCIPDMTFHQWRARNFVPPAQWLKIIKMAVSRGYPINMDMLEKQRDQALKGKKK